MSSAPVFENELLASLTNPIYKDAEHKFIAATIAYPRVMRVDMSMVTGVATLKQDAPGDDVFVLYYDKECTKPIMAQELLAAVLNGLFICDQEYGCVLGMCVGVIPVGGDVLAVRAVDDSTMYLSGEVAQFEIPEQLE